MTPLCSNVFHFSSHCFDLRRRFDRFALLRRFDRFALLRRFDRFALLRRFDRFTLLRRFDRFTLLRRFDRFALLRRFDRFALLRRFVLRWRRDTLYLRVDCLFDRQLVRSFFDFLGAITNYNVYN